MNSREMIRSWIEDVNEEKRYSFQSLGTGGHYTEAQKKYAFELIDEHGLRATARILKIPRRTLQRWCRRIRKFVQPCPPWIWDWAYGRQRRRQFWQYRGYG